MLIGVNIGPNLTYVGSLANLLWRGVVQRGSDGSDGSDDVDAGFAEFSRVGLCTTPIVLFAAVLGLWAGLRMFNI